MFCPKCKSEYREGFKECGECKVPLVKALPPESKPEYAEFEEIYSTFNHADIVFVKSVLHDAGIKYFIKGEHFTLLQPQFVEPMKVMVRKDQAEVVLELLKDFKPGSQMASGKVDNEEDD